MVLCGIINACKTDFHFGFFTISCVSYFSLCNYITQCNWYPGGDSVPVIFWVVIMFSLGLQFTNATILSYMIPFYISLFEIHIECHCSPLETLTVSPWCFSLDEEEEDDVVAPKPLVEPEEEKTLKKEEEEEGTVHLKTFWVCSKESHQYVFNFLFY